MADAVRSEILLIGQEVTRQGDSNYGHSEFRANRKGKGMSDNLVLLNC